MENTCVYVLYENLHMLFTKVVTIFLIIFIEIMRTNVIQKFTVYKILLENFFKFCTLYNL